MSGTNSTSPSCLSAALGLLLMAGPAIAQIQPQLLVDLENTPTPISSAPEFGAEINGVCVFAATDLLHGRELWRTTPSGAVLLADIFPGSAGSNPRGFTVFADRVWFAATDPVAGTELWATDGTTAGTVLVADLEAGIEGSAPNGFVVCGNQLFFTAFETAAGREPHVTDGTTNGTRFVKDVQPGIEGSAVADSHRFVCCNGQVIFVADDGVHGPEPWKSDGTVNGTLLITQVSVNATRGGVDASVPPVCCNGRVYFRGDDRITGNELWATDGTANGTVQVANLRPGALASDPRNLTCLGNDLLFTARDSALGEELFKSDGTTAGTGLLVDVFPGSTSSLPAGLTRCGNLVFFAAQPSFELGKELFRTDGTAAGTFMVRDIFPGVGSSFPDHFTCCGSLVFFAGRDNGSGTELFVTDGTDPGTVRLGDLNPGAANSDPHSIICCGSRVLFAATSGGETELYASDGTSNGTGLLADLEPGQTNGDSEPAAFTPAGPNRFYFVATTTATGRELFFFDGTNAVPLEVEPGPDGSDPSDLVMVGNTLYFAARTAATGSELFSTRGTQTPQLVADLSPGTSSSFPRDLTAFNERQLICVASIPGKGSEVVVVENGVSPHREFDIRPGGFASSARDFHVIFGSTTGTNLCLFTANDGTVGQEMFMFDGIDVSVAADFNPGASGSFPTTFSPRADGTALVFSIFDGGSTRIMEVTVDETTDFGGPDFRELADLAISFLVRNLATIQVALPNQVIELLAVLAPASGGTDFEPYHIDRNGNANLLGDLRPGPKGSDPLDLRVTESGFTFTADDGEHGRELYSVDAVTGFLNRHDLRPGHESSDPQTIASIGDKTLVSGHAQSDDTDDIFTMEVRIGTFLPVGEFDASAGAAVGSDLIMSVRDPNTGQEVFVIEDTGTAFDGSAVTIGFPCDGKARTRATNPRVGGPTTWSALGGPSGSVGLMFFDLGRLLPLLLGNCEVWIDFNTAILAFLGNAPGLSGTITIPNLPNLIGASYTIQTVWFEPVTSSITTSNAVLNTVGR